MAKANNGDIARELLDRGPPHDIDAETTLLGSVFLEPQRLADVQAVVGPGDFYDERHKHLADELWAMHAAGIPIGTDELWRRIKAAGHTRRIGGLTYLGKIVQAVPGASRAGYYAGIVRTKAQQRAILQPSTRLL